MRVAPFDARLLMSSLCFSSAFTPLACGLRAAATGIPGFSGLSPESFEAGLISRLAHRRTCAPLPCKSDCPETNACISFRQRLLQNSAGIPFRKPAGSLRPESHRRADFSRPMISCRSQKTAESFITHGRWGLTLPALQTRKASSRQTRYTNLGQGSTAAPSRGVAGFPLLPASQQ